MANTYKTGGLSDKLPKKSGGLSGKLPKEQCIYKGVYFIFKSATS